MGVISERYPATVTDTADPERRGRIKVTCAGLLGDDKTALPMWVEPVPLWGWFVVPEVGEIVEVEAVTSSSEDEQPGQMSIDNLDIKWRGERYFGNENGEKPTPVPEDFTATNYGKRRGFATPGGHVMMFDDTAGQEKISWTWHQNGKWSFFSIDKTGSIILSTHSKHMIHLDAEAGEIKIWDQHGNMYVSDANRVMVFQKDTNMLEMKSDGNVQLLAQSGVMVSAKVSHLNTGEVLLGEGLAPTFTEFAVLGTTFASLLGVLLAAMGLGTGVADPNAPACSAWIQAVAAAANTMNGSLAGAISTSVKLK